MKIHFFSFTEDNIWKNTNDLGAEVPIGFKWDLFIGKAASCLSVETCVLNIYIETKLNSLWIRDNFS